MPLHSLNDFQPFWGNLWAPPLLFGRRPPQSNCPPDTVRIPVHGYPLEPQQWKSGIPSLTPQELTPLFPSLPPILYIRCRDSISSYSKALRGLSVQSRVNTHLHVYYNFAGLPVRYAIRAGRNLPDKEFRYLRTVIVTAAVHWGLSSMLRLATNISP